MSCILPSGISISLLWDSAFALSLLNDATGRRYGTILAPVTGEATGKRFHQFNLLSDSGEALQPTLYVIVPPSACTTQSASSRPWQIQS